MNKAARIASMAAVIAVGAGGSIATATNPAHAGGTVWDRVAKCESGGNWRINTGNGFYGGLQFSASTWRAYGGGAYASYAHRATKAQQIAIARKVLKSQGPGAWPVCSVRAGLTRANGGASSSATAPKPTAQRAKAKVATKHKTVSRSKARVSIQTVKGARYTVKSGDSLSKIASRHHVKGGWKALWHKNKSIHNPNMIKVGQVIHL